jgi:hypothetical protein
MKTLSEVALSYVGKTEKPNNSGFKDAEFEKKMKNVGWIKSQAWCAYFAELSVIEWANEIGRNDIAKLATKLFSGGSTATFKNFEIYATQNPTGIVRISKKPVANSIAIYRHGSGWQGHAAITASVQPDMFVNNIEGNTNYVGGREGYIVAKKRRNHNAPYSAKGLNIVGYIYFV